MTKLPRYTEFFSPVLQCLVQSKEGMRRPQVIERVAAQVGLNDEQLRQPMPGGRGLLHENRIGWALSYLKYAGLAETPTRGNWRLTEAGEALIKQHPHGLPAPEVSRIVSQVRADYLESRGQDAEGSTEAQDLPTTADSGKGPEEIIESAINELEGKVAAELLSEIAKITDRRFELLVLDVLEAMGYAWASAGVEHTGRSGDGGIDGVINMDPLGIQKIYVQAKKWTGNVGRKEIQAFVGSLAGFQARMGVFIASSEFTREAREYAEKTSDRLVLVDGQKLARLMIQHGVGVTPQTVKLPKVDSDYFDDA